MTHANGFSFIELLTTILIVGILVAVAMFSMPNKSGFELYSVRDEVLRDIRFVQNLAMSKNTSYTVTLTNTSTGSYTISPTPPAGPGTVTLPSGVTFSAANTITFDPNGTPNAAATITIRSSTGILGTPLNLVAQTGFIE